MLQKTRQRFKKTSGYPKRIISNFIHRGNRSIYKRMIKLLDIQANDKLLEIGYGPGIGINLIASECNSCEIHGIDASELMLKVSAKSNKQFIDDHKVELQSGDFMETTLGAKDFEKIFCINSVNFGDNLHSSFERIKSLLKDDGTFYLHIKGKVDKETFKFSKKNITHRYTIEQVVEALKSAGFEKVYYFIERGYYIRAVK